MDDLLALILIIIGCVSGYFVGISMKKKLHSSIDLDSTDEIKTNFSIEKSEDNTFYQDTLMVTKNDSTPIIHEKPAEIEEIIPPQITIPFEQDKPNDEEQNRLAEEQKQQEMKSKFTNKMKKIDETEIKVITNYIQNNRHIFFDSRYKNNLNFVYLEYLNEIREKLLKQGYSFNLTEVEWMVDEIKGNIEPKKTGNDDD